MILSEAEKSRLIYIILDRIKLADMTRFYKEIKGVKKYIELEGANEDFGAFVKRNKILTEMVPLWSKSNLIRAGREGISDPKQSALSKQVKDVFSLYIDV